MGLVEYMMGLVKPRPATTDPFDAHKDPEHMSNKPTNEIERMRDIPGHEDDQIIGSQISNRPGSTIGSKLYK